MSIPSNPVVGTVYKIGTAFENGAKIARPTKPWSPSTQIGVSSTGDIKQYASGNVEFRDTDSADAYQVQWVYVGNNKYICDRNMWVSISWDTLNAQGYITGKTVTIDGVSCKLTAIDGGGSDTGTSGNQWNDYILNKLSNAALPTPNAEDLNTSLVSADISSAHNAKWNWAGCYSWCSNIYSAQTSYRVIRGYTGAATFVSTAPSGVLTGIGFRPVLEILNSAPLISDPAADANLGNKSSEFNLSYTISDPDGDTFSIVAVLDTATILNLTNQSAGTRTLAITGTTWSGLSLGSHTITITATDTKSASTTRTLTFAKVNQPPTAPVITGLATGQRIPGSGSVSFTPATDPDGDTLTYSLQFASDSGFTQNLQSFSGNGSPIAYSGVAVNNSRYVRVVANDGNATTASGAIQIKIGDKLEFTSLPINRGTMPVSALVLLDATIDPAATLTLYVCNNANDASPTWENCTSEYNAGTPHTFTNASKTNASWAVGLRVVVNAGTATGTIEVRAFGFDIVVN